MSTKDDIYSLAAGQRVIHRFPGGQRCFAPSWWLHIIKKEIIRMFREMRRKKQELSKEECLELTPDHITGKLVNES